MGKLLMKSYVSKCILGAEVIYVVCLAGGFLSLQNAEATKLHHMLFETLPGFTWINIQSVLLGALYVLVFSVIVGAYYVWMHNSSIGN